MTELGAVLEELRAIRRALERNQRAEPAMRLSLRAAGALAKMGRSGALRAAVDAGELPMHHDDKGRPFIVRSELETYLATRPTTSPGRPARKRRRPPTATSRRAPSGDDEAAKIAAWKIP